VVPNIRRGNEVYKDIIGNFDVVAKTHDGLWSLLGVGDRQHREQQDTS
jgi:hypothetical protein